MASFPGPNAEIRACPSLLPANLSEDDEAAKKIASLKICSDTGIQA